MFPTRILVAVDGFKETSRAVRAAVESAGGTGSELHLVHVVPTEPEWIYLHLAAKEGVEPLRGPEMEAQMAAIRAGLRFPGPPPTVSVYDIREFIY